MSDPSLIKLKDHTVKLAKVEVTLGFFPIVEESLLLTAAEGTDSKGNERWAMVGVEREEKTKGAYI